MSSRAGPSTRLHPRERVEHFRDRGVTCGPFKVYPRTDGRSVVVDRRRPWNDLGVCVLEREEHADRECARLGELEGFRVGQDWSD